MRDDLFQLQKDRVMETPQIIESAKVPNFFYDLIVFMTPSLTFTLGIIIGLGDYGIKVIRKDLESVKLEGLDSLVIVIFVFILFLFIAYEYGRIVEVLSTSISDVITSLRSKRILFTKQGHYNIDFKTEIAKLNLAEMLGHDRIDKWTIYFYAMRFQPAIGSDILKRYAWEKLARSSSFTFGILFCVSILMASTRIFKLESLLGYRFLDTGIFGFGSLAFTLGSFVLFTVTCYEFYIRRSWNNDLLAKLLPIIGLPDNFVLHRMETSDTRTVSEKGGARKRLNSKE